MKGKKSAYADHMRRLLAGAAREGDFGNAMKIARTDLLADGHWLMARDIANLINAASRVGESKRGLQIFEMAAEVAELVRSGSESELKASRNQLLPAKRRTQKPAWEAVAPNEVCLTILMKCFETDPSMNYALLCAALAAAKGEGQAAVTSKVSEQLLTTFARNAFKSGDFEGADGALALLAEDGRDMPVGARLLLVRLFSGSLEVEKAILLLPQEDATEDVSRQQFCQALLDLAFAQSCVGRLEESEALLQRVRAQFPVLKALSKRSEGSHRLFLEHSLPGLQTERKELRSHLRALGGDGAAAATKKRSRKIRRVLRNCFSLERPRCPLLDAPPEAAAALGARPWGWWELLPANGESAAVVERRQPAAEGCLGGEARDLEVQLPPAPPKGWPSGALEFSALLADNPGGLSLEIGSGFGEWVMERAEADPSSLWISNEIRYDRCVKIYRRMVLSGIKNVRLAHGDCGILLRILPPAALKEAFVLFPPSPTKFATADHFLLRPVFFVALHRTLRKDGSFILFTDSALLAAAFRQHVPWKLFATDKARNQQAGAKNLGLGGTYFDRFWSNANHQHREMIRIRPR